MKKLDEVLKALHPLEIKVLLAFKEIKAKKKPKVSGFGEGELCDSDIININKMSKEDLRRAIGWLNTKKLIEIIPHRLKSWVCLTELGEKYYKKGIPEKQMVEFINKQFSKDNLPKIKDINFLEPLELSEAIGFLKKENIIEIKPGGVLTFSDATYKKKKVVGKVEHLQSIINKAHSGIVLEDSPDWKIIEERHRKRGQAKGIFKIERESVYTFKLTNEGKQLLNVLPSKSSKLEEISQLTPEILKAKSWREKEFREYNIELRPPRIVAGKLHPYQEFLNIVREKLISMGFCEVSGELVESEFWNMDVLFMPQQHPARDVHGIYFVKS
ncbi:hypothetical protein KAW50_07565, partial [candidate division WOR-3 bacterium]|nr:hypothetical protein [candidate division WOR-3 bacterium]